VPPGSPAVNVPGPTSYLIVLQRVNTAIIPG
jgi:hypothetical protein